MYSKHINDDIQVELLNYIDKYNVDYNLIVWTSNGSFIKLFLQPKIDEFGVVVAITSPDSKDDSFIIHQRYRKEIVWAMDDIKRYYEERQV